MRTRVYLPKGDHEDGSWGCVLIAPAGTNLLSGSSISPDYHDETLPYAEAGLAVVLYTLDGEMPESGAEEAMSAAYKQSKAAPAGMANRRKS